MICGVGHRCGSDPVLLWLWCRPAATALIRLPSLGTFICCRCGPKKIKKKNRKYMYGLTVTCYSMHFLLFIQKIFIVCSSMCVPLVLTLTVAVNKLVKVVSSSS